MVVPVHDQTRAAGLDQGVDRGEAMLMAGRSLMRYQNVEAALGEAVECVGKNAVAVPKRQATAPSAITRQGRQE